MLKQKITGQQKAGEDFNSLHNSFDTNVFYGTRFEWYQTLVSKIQKVSNEIHRLTLRGGANFVVVAPKVATILESLPGYVSQMVMVEMTNSAWVSLR